MNYLAPIYKCQYLELLKKYADKVKTGIDFFLFNRMKISVYLSNKKVIAYTPQNLNIQNQLLLKNKLNDKYQRIIEIKKTVMGFIIPDNFIFSEKGIIAIKETQTKNRDKKIQYLNISDRWIFVETRVYSKYHKKYQYEVRSYDPISKKSTIELCDSEVLARCMPCLTFLSNSLAIITEEGYKKELVTFFDKFIKENKRNMKKKSTIPHMGYNDDMTEFFPYSNKLHLDFTGDISKYLRNTVDAFKPHGNKINFIESLLEFTKNRDSDFVVSTAFAAPLLELINIRSFAINFYGKSGSLKSLASKFAISCFGNPKKLASAGNHTRNVLIEKLSKFHNLPFYVDEITEDSIDIYSIGNETGRHRLNKAGQILETIAWRTIMFCTSEASMEKDSNRGGEINRLLCIPINCVPKGMDSENLDKEEYARNKYMFLTSNYGLLGEDYIKYIISQKEEINIIFSKIVKAIYDPEKQKQHIYIIASICLANYIYKKIFSDINNLDNSIILGSYCISKLSKKKDLDPSLKMLETIYEFYEINKPAFIHDNFSLKTNYCYGKVDKLNNVYFILNPLKQYLIKNGFNWNEKKDLIEKELIEYKTARIENIGIGKRIVLNLNNYALIEREGIQNEDNYCTIK